MNTKRKVNALLIITGLILLFGCDGCATYPRLLRKFGHLSRDSTQVSIYDTVFIKKDSVVLRLKTDTTTFHRIIEQGRARINYDRTPKLTTIKAECKPDTIIRTITAKCPPVATFGIAPWYKTAFHICLGVIGIGVIAYFFSHLFKLSVTRRSNEIDRR